MQLYNSWIAMQQAGETDADACDFNDFALVRVHPADAASVNPTIPFWGGPTGTAGSVTDTGKVLSYGNSSLRLGIDPLKPKEGLKVGTEGGGWSHEVYTATPGIPGDSGSAFIDRAGRAVGVLSTLQIAPAAGSIGVGDVGRAVAYMESHGGPDVTLANGTEPFTGPLLP
jgi:S1-C subfamily serine protease